MQEIERAAEMVGGMLQTAVELTVNEPTPDPARQIIGELVNLDRRAAPDSENGGAQVLAMLIMVRRLALVREQLADQPDRVEKVLGWIEESLGRRYRARSRYTSGPLESEAAAADISTYRPALRDDFLPTLVWLLAGAVAVYGAGDIAWLEALETGRPSATSFFTGPDVTRGEG